MNPVHVIVGNDPRAQAMWVEAFAGSIDLYSFDRNVEAFERMTAAEAPVDLVVLTPAQDGPFNLTPDQFVSRVLEGAMGSSRYLANLHVVVVGQSLTRQHPRAIEVATLDAAIRLVKYGEAPQVVRAHIAEDALAPSAQLASVSAGSVGTFSESVISSIWDAADAAERAERSAERSVVGGGGRVAVPASMQAPVAAAPALPPQLFERPAADGFVIAPQVPVAGGGASQHQVGTPDEAIEVASGLQASRPYSLPNGAGYRGPVVRQGQVPAASHHALAIGAPVPPALQAQVQQVVYGAAAGVPDPVLVWSSAHRSQVVTAGVPVPTAAPMPAAAVTAAPQHAQLRTVPMEPPVGMYGGPAAAPAPMAQPAPPNPALQADPMLQRVEREHAAVSFG